MLQFLGQDNWEKPKHHTGRLWHFSDVEKQHLRLAMGAFTLALGFMAVGGVSGISSFGFSPWLVFLLVSTVSHAGILCGPTWFRSDGVLT